MLPFDKYIYQEKHFDNISILTFYFYFHRTLKMERKIKSGQTFMSSDRYQNQTMWFYLGFILTLVIPAQIKPNLKPLTNQKPWRFWVNRYRSDFWPNPVTSWFLQWNASQSVSWTSGFSSQVWESTLAQKALPWFPGWSRRRPPSAPSPRCLAGRKSRPPRRGSPPWGPKRLEVPEAETTRSEKKKLWNQSRSRKTESEKL